MYLHDLDAAAVGCDYVCNVNFMDSSPDILLQGDLLGRFWERVESSRTEGLPGLWALCALEVAPSLPCQCWHAPLDLSAPWDDARAIMAGSNNITTQSVFVFREGGTPTLIPSPGRLSMAGLSGWPGWLAGLVLCSD